MEVCRDIPPTCLVNCGDTLMHEVTVSFFHNKPTPRSKLIFLEMEVAQLPKKSQSSMEPEGSLRLHKNPSPVTSLSQINPVHTLSLIFLTSILTLSSHPHQGLPSGFFPLNFTIKIA
jgi:hypothetical protein